MVQIEVLTGLTLQTRIQHMHVDLYTDFEVSIIFNHIKLGLIPGNFKILVFNLNLSFLREYQKNENYLNFGIILKLAIPIMSIFV